jgi:hemoglobin
MRAFPAPAPVLALVLALAGACWTGAETEPRRPEPERRDGRPALFERAGGMDALRAIVDSLLANVAADGRINMYFMNADIPALREHLVTWLCVASRGPCRYRGKELRDAHAGMLIDGDSFDAFVEAFTNALNRHGVRGREKVELVLLLRRAHGSVVER